MRRRPRGRGYLNVYLVDFDHRRRGSPGNPTVSYRYLDLTNMDTASLEIADSVYTKPDTEEVTAVLVVRKKSSAVVLHSISKLPQEDNVVYFDFLNETVAVVLWSRAFSIIDISSGKRVSMTTLQCGYCSTGVLLQECNVFVAGCGDDVEAYDITDRETPRLKPLEYIYGDDFNPAEGIEFAFSVLPGGRLVDIEERDGKLSFVVWSITEQKVLSVFPFTFPEGFKPTYCNRRGLEKLQIGDYGDHHFIVDLARSGDWVRIQDDGADGDESMTCDQEEISYFWKLVSLGGSFFASLPRESIDGVWVHVWDVSAGVRIANFCIGVGPADSARRLSDDIIAIRASGESEDQIWNIRTGQRVDDTCSQ